MSDLFHDLWVLRVRSERTSSRGASFLPLFCAGLIPLSHPSLFSVVALCIFPIAVALPFIVLGFAERFAPIPADLRAAAERRGLRRRFLEPRHKWLDRIYVAEWKAEADHG